MSYIISSGESSDGIILQNNSMTVLNGGIANNTTVSSYGFLHVSSGGTANNTVVNRGWVYISSGGTAMEAAISSGGRILVYRGGTANSITVYSSSWLIVSNTGTANDVTVYSGGVMSVSEATANNAIISGGSMVLNWFAAVNSITVKDGGTLRVSSDTTANSVTVKDGGTLLVSSGGTALNVVRTPCEGHIYVNEGAYVTYASQYSGVYYGSDGHLLSIAAVINDMTINSACEMNVMSNGTANDITINQYGSAYVYKGGTANSTTVNSGGSLILSSGGTAFEIRENGGTVYIGNGATVTFTPNEFSGFVLSGASATVHSSTTANNTTIRSGGWLDVCGGTANKTTVSSGGRILVYSDGRVNSTTVSSGGRLTLSDGGTANNTTVNSGGGLDVSSGGTANNIDLWDAANLSVLNGGTINYTKTQIWSVLTVSSGGTANHTDIFAGSMLVYIGGTANDTIVGGIMEVSSGGTALGTTISGGTLYISSGGTAFDVAWTPCEGRIYVYEGAHVTYASQYSGVYYGSYGHLLSSAAVINDITINSACEMNVMSNGTANDTTINKYGSAYVSSGGKINDVTVNSGGSLTISSGGKAFEIRENGGTVYVGDGAAVTFASNTISGASLYHTATIHSGTTANSTMVQSNGFLEIFSGGIATNTTACSGGRVCVSSGGIMTGQMILESGMYFSACAGAVFDFNVSELNPNGSAFINDFSLISSASFASYMLTIGEEQIYGDYLLANGVTKFINSIMVVDTDDAFLGYIALEDTLTVNGTKYTLNLSDGSLSVSIGEGETPPDPVVVNSVSVSSATRVVGSEKTYVSTRIGYRGILEVTSGGLTQRTIVGPLNLNDSTAYGNQLPPAGQEIVYSGGRAERTSVLFGSQLVYGLASACFLSNMAAMTTDVYYTLYNDLYGSQIVLSGGTADATIIDAGGLQYIMSSGLAVNTYVSRVGCQYVSSGGIARNTTLSRGGQIVIDGGVADGVFNHGGRAFVSSGGKLTGKITFSETISVCFYEGSILDFDLTQTEAGAEALVNDLSIIQGAPLYTLTVDGTQADGVYSLAEGAAGFNSTISVVNAVGDELGTLAVGQTVTIGDTEYTLNLNDTMTGSTLTVTVAGSEPVPPTPSWKFYTGDFNGDGADMLAAQAEDSNVVTVYWNGEPWGLGVTLDPGWEIAGVGDFNGDLMDDFLRVNDEGYVVGEMSNGNGTFSPQVLNLKNTGWDILGVGDFDGNGTDDVLIANPTGASETVGLLGYWESGVTWTLINGYSAEWECVSTGDFNADGKCDMLWRNSFEGEGGLTYNAYCTWITDDPVDWRMVSVANPDEWDFLCSGDFDGNGSHDIAMINDVGVVGIWGVNDGYLSSWSILSAVNPSEWQLAGVADFNADGTDDIAWCNNSTGLAGYWQINDKQLTAWSNIATIA